MRSECRFNRAHPGRRWECSWASRRSLKRLSGSAAVPRACVDAGAGGGCRGGRSETDATLAYERLVARASYGIAGCGPSKGCGAWNASRSIAAQAFRRSSRRQEVRVEKSTSGRYTVGKPQAWANAGFTPCVQGACPSEPSPREALFFLVAGDCCRYTTHRRVCVGRHLCP